MLHAVPTEPVASASRVEYHRTGMVEWYENRSEGLEQGFTLLARPRGEGQIRIEGRISGDLSARGGPNAVDFMDATGVCALRYGKLVVHDARRTRLEARMIVSNDRLSIVFEDREAAYPVTVDPLMTSPVWTAEGDQTSATFGHSVATAGDVNGDGFSDVVVGADQYDNGQTDEGRVFVYHGSVSGLATSPAWTAESNQAEALFGVSVAAAGDVNGDGYSDIIVGASAYDNGQTSEGAAFVYHGSSTGLASTPAWTAEGNQASAAFGGSVATAGDVNGDSYSDVIVSATAYANGQAYEGAVFVYHGSSGGLASTPASTVEGNQAFLELGTSVSSAGDVNGDGYSDVIIGATLYGNGETYEGRTIVYHGSSSGLAASPSWTLESNQAEARFGQSVATAGDVNGDGYSDVIVGAFWYDNGQSDEGRAFVFHGSSSGLGSSAAWTAEGDQADAWLGSSVATAGDVNGDGFSDVIVGAYRYDDFAGRALVYLGSSGGLASTAAWTEDGTQEAAFFGESVATAGDVNGDGYSDVIVGAPAYDNGQDGEGRASVYHGSADGLVSGPAWTVEGNATSANLGYSVATAGDVNGDGYSDVVVGAYGYSNGQEFEGRALVFHGSAAGLSSTAAWTAESNQAGAQFGWSVATAGDVNGDGYSDLVVGANGYDNGQSQEGRAFVFHGSASGLSATAAWTAEINEGAAFFGHSVGGAGDVNGDGYSDVVVGAPFSSSGQYWEGRAFVFHGSAAGLASTPNWTAEGNNEGAHFGASVATAGDVNGDGYSEIIVGAYGYTNGHGEEGRAFVYHGAATGLATTAAWSAEGDQTVAWFGYSVATAGDVNGDGYSDIIVGSIFYDNGETNEGQAFVYHGSSSGLASSANWTADSDQTGSVFGSSVSTAGDVNGDSYADVLVGAPSYANGEDSEGRAFVYHGSSGGVGSTPAWTGESNQINAGFGSSVTSAGDANGDGFSDIIIGAYGYSDGENAEGRAYGFYGNGADGLDRVPRQRRGDDSGPISLLGESPNLRLRTVGRSPGGRNRVRMEWEVKPLGTPFNGSTTKGSFVDTGAPVGGAGSSAPLSENVSGLGDGPKHWRLRVLTDTPFFPRSRWLYLPDNGHGETDLRIDVSAPATTSDLYIASYGSGSVTLEWTAPGDDGTSGRSSSYIVRKRSGSEITEANWATSTDVSGEPVPAAAGTTESMSIGGLTSGVFWYFALKTVDNVGNTSGVSNNDCIKFGNPPQLCEGGGSSAVPSREEGSPRWMLAITGVRPNPTSDGGVDVAFTLSGPGARLDVLDISGRRVETHNLGQYGPGVHTLRIGAYAKLVPGHYWVRIHQGDRRVTSNAIVVR